MYQLQANSNLSSQENQLVQQIQSLNSEAGSHSPSLSTLYQAIPDLKIEVDACFLSNPFATDLVLDRIKSQVISNPEFLHRTIEAYPSQNQAIAEQFAPAVGADPSRMLIANGATEAIQAVIKNFASHLHIAIPTFSPYYEFADERTAVTEYRLNTDDDFVVDPEEYVRSVKESGADVAVLITPNNPDGRNIPVSDLVWMLEQLRDLRAVIVDESFIHFSRIAEQHDGLPTLVKVVESFENVILVKSMSKDFGVAGIRAGYALMNSSRVERLLDSGYLWNTNGFAEYFFLLFPDDQFLDKYKEALSHYLGVIDRFTAKSSTLSIVEPVPTESNFQLMRLPNGISSDVTAALLLYRYGVYVRSCSDKIGLDGDNLRVAIRTEKENELVLDAIEEVVTDLVG